MKLNVFIIEKQLDDPVVGIPYFGWLKGSIAWTKWSNRSFYQFLGVKYAESPSGARRFKVEKYPVFEYCYLNNSKLDEMLLKTKTKTKIKIKDETILTIL